MDSALQLPGMSTNNGGPSALVKREPAPQGPSNLTLRRRRQRQRRSLRKANRKIQDLQAILNRSPEALRRIEAEVTALQAKLVAHPLTSTTAFGLGDPPAILPAERHLHDAEYTRIERHPGSAYRTETQHTCPLPASNALLGQDSQPVMQSLKRHFKEDVDDYGNAEIINTELPLDTTHPMQVQPIGRGGPKLKQRKTEIASSNASMVKDAELELSFESYIRIPRRPASHTAPASRSTDRLNELHQRVNAAGFHQAPRNAPRTAPKLEDPMYEVLLAARLPSSFNTQGSDCSYL